MVPNMMKKEILNDLKTLERLKDVTQFCGCDYTKLSSPLFL